MKRLRTRFGIALSVLVMGAATACGGGDAAVDSGTGDGATAGSDAAPADAAQPVRLRLATVNLRCLLDDWPARRELLIAQLAAADPDVIAFQEACRADSGDDNLAELVAGLAPATGRDYRIARTETHWSWDLYHEGIALVSGYELTRVDIVDLPAGTFPRRAIVATVASAPGPVLVAATHLSFGDDQAAVRVDQLQAIRDAIARMGRDDQLSVIAGDCNEGPDGDAITAALAAGYHDCFAEANPGQPGYTYPASAPTERIDQVLALPGTSGVGIAAAAVFLDQVDGTTMASDHLGIHVDFEAP